MTIRKILDYRASSAVLQNIPKERISPETTLKINLKNTSAKSNRVMTVFHLGNTFKTATSYVRMYGISFKITLGVKSTGE